MTAAPIKPDRFRALMRHVPAAVNIIATGNKGRRNGLTATSVCSLSDSPPKLLVCVNHRASAHEEIIENMAFSVNVLSVDDEPLGRRFAGNSGSRGEARFQDDVWSDGVTGSPVLKNALCHLECQVVEAVRSSTHTVFFGEVVAGAFREDADPLLYVAGAFRSLQTAK